MVFIPLTKNVKNLYEIFFDKRFEKYNCYRIAFKTLYKSKMSI